MVCLLLFGSSLKKILWGLEPCALQANHSFEQAAD